MIASLKELKEKVYKANLEVPEKGLAIYTFGNVSGINENRELVVIKPSGVPYNELKPSDMVVVDMQGRVVEGSMRPSSDTKTHVLLYKYFETVGGICHTHSTYAVAWAQSKKSIPILGTTHADHLVSDVPCTPDMTEDMIKGDYELETGNQILHVFKNLSYTEVEMVLVASHGPFTWGKTPAKAVYNSVVLEELAKMAYLTLQINPHTTPISQALKDKHYFRKHGKHAYYGQGC